MDTLEYIKALNENNVYAKKVRIDIDVYEIRDTLLRLIDERDMDNLQEYLYKKITSATIIEKSVKKAIAAEKATAFRIKQAKRKIDNAINILRMENKKITHYSISKVAEVSYNTVKKYIALDEMKSLNIN